MSDAAAARRWVVSDPGLRTASGHNAGALATLGAALGRRGRFFGHEAPEAELAALGERLGLEVTRFFRTSFYDGYARDWTVAQAQPYIGALSDEYVRLLRRLEGEPGADGVLHHTMDWPHLVALGAALARQRGGPRHAVFLMFNPGVDARASVFAPRRLIGYRTAFAALLRHEQVRLYAACSELAGIYRGALDLPQPPPIHPCFFFDAAAAPARGSSGSHALLYAGDAKEEKGFCELPTLAGLLLRHAPGTALKIHYNVNSYLAAPRVQQAQAALAALAREHPRLELLARFVPEAELASLLHDASCVFFHYRPSAYAHQTSGLLWQACSAGAPVLVIGDTWLAREARRMHPRVRTFRHLGEFGEALRRGAALRFEPAAFDADYRAQLFRPVGDFMNCCAAI